MATQRKHKGPGHQDELLSYQIAGDISKLANKLTREYRKLGGSGGVVAKANQASIDWLAKRAIANLHEKIQANRRPQYAATNYLARAIRNPESHTVTNKGFRFMVEAKVRKVMGHERDYAFSLEYGDSSQIGRNIYFLFLGRKLPAGGRFATEAFNVRGDSAERHRTAHPKNIFRSNDRLFGVQNQSHANAANLTTDRIIGPRESATGGKGGGALQSNYIKDAKRYRVTIRNPVPEYRYGRDAAAAFLSEHIYEQKLQEVVDLKKVLKDTKTALVPGKKKANLVGKGKNGPVTVSKA